MIQSYNRRQFLQRLLGSMALSPAVLSRLEAAAPRNFQIRDVRVLVTNPTGRLLGNYVLVRIDTSEPEIYGWGDCTCSGSELGVAKFLEEHLKPALIGRNPLRIQDIWDTVYHLPYYRSGSVHMSAVSGIDMALWDIKGKVADLPVYELLGGKARTKLLTYQSVGGRSFEEVADRARGLMAEGYKVIKVQVAPPGASAGYGFPASPEQAEADRKRLEAGLPPIQQWEPGLYVQTLPKFFEYLRKELGEEIELIHDVHERITPQQAIYLAKALEPYRLFYFEDPLRPEHLDTFRIIRQQCSTPLAMGEVFTGIYEGLYLITEHLIDYIRHDLVHCGGITAGKKLAAIAEPYGILTAWHGPGNISPVAHMANCHVSLSVSNFGIQEYSRGWAPEVQEVFTDFPRYEDGYVTIGEKPGLGIDVREEVAKKYPYQRRLRPMIRRADDSAWAY